MSNLKICKKCSHENMPQAKFCTECGTQISNSFSALLRNGLLILLSACVGAGGMWAYSQNKSHDKSKHHEEHADELEESHQELNGENSSPEDGHESSDKEGHGEGEGSSHGEHEGGSHGESNDPNHESSKGEASHDSPKSHDEKGSHSEKESAPEVEKEAPQSSRTIEAAPHNQEHQSKNLDQLIQTPKPVSHTAISKHSSSVKIGKKSQSVQNQDHSTESLSQGAHGFTDLSHQFSELVIRAPKLAKVSIDGQFKGMGTVIENVTLGSHLIVVEQEGFKSVSQTLKVDQKHHEFLPMMTVD